jgi:hypothetical protein
VPVRRLDQLPDGGDICGASGTGSGHGVDSAPSSP